MGRRGIVFAAVAVMFAAVMLPEVAAVRYIVGGNMGWTSNVNYTIWAQTKHFYNGDWLCMLSLILLSDLLFSAFFFI